MLASVRPVELSDYLPILIYFAAGLAVAGAIFTLSKVVRSKPNPAKVLPYESGILPGAPVRQRFSIDLLLVPRGLSGVVSTPFTPKSSPCT